MKTLTILTILTILSILSGCTSNLPSPVEKIIYINTTLSLPAKPTLPTLKSSDVECLSTETKQKLIDRDRIRKNYIEQLELIITSTKN